MAAWASPSPSSARLVARHVGVNHHLDHLEQTLLVLVANFVSFAIFWVVKLLVFNRLFHVELDEFDEHLTHDEAVAVEVLRP